MTVCELVEALTQMPPNATVQVQGDSGPEINIEEITMSHDNTTVTIG